jgi:hypothetical protein
MDTPEIVIGRMRFDRAAITDEAGPTESWPGPVLEDLPKSHQAHYLTNRRAVLMWIAKKKVKDTEASTGLNAGQALRLVKRCVEVNPATGSICGFWACVPGWKPTQRRVRSSAFKKKFTQKGDGLSGALQNLFLHHPTVHEKLVKFIRTRSESGSAPVSVLRPGNVHERFIALCKDEGRHVSGAWPFDVDRRGYEAVRRWFRKAQYDAPLQSIANELGDDAAKISKVDFQTSSNPKPRDAHLAYERVEIDEHKKDELWAILTPIGNDRFAYVAARRIWALALRDVGSTAIFSSGVSYGLSYNRADVLSLVHRALNPPKLKQLMLANPHFQYDAGACFPGQEGSELAELKGNFWQLLAIDRHSTHFANDVLLAMEHVVGCHIAGERVGQPTARHAMERWFQLLATMSQNMPSAVGNRPNSPARRNPEAAAQRWCVVAPLAEHLLDVMCRNYNVTPSAQCGGDSPVHRLKEMLAQGRVYRCPIGELRQSNLFLLLPRYRAEAGRKRGKDNRLGPLGVNLFGGRYVGPELTKDIELAEALDKSVWVYVREDATHAVVVPFAFPERHYDVTLVGMYSDQPHTLATRRLASAFAKNRHIKGHADSASLITGVTRGLGEAARTDNAAAALLSGTVAFQDRYGRGDASYIGMSEADIDRLANYARSIAREDAELDEEAQEQGGELWVPPERTAPSSASPVASTPPAAKPRHDPFGLLGDM